MPNVPKPATNVLEELDGHGNPEVSDPSRQLSANVAHGRAYLSFSPADPLASVYATELHTDVQRSKKRYTTGISLNVQGVQED